MLPRQKKIPDMKKLMARDPAARRVQTPDEQWAIFVAMAEKSKMIGMH